MAAYAAALAGQTPIKIGARRVKPGTIERSGQWHALETGAPEVISGLGPTMASVHKGVNVL
jgi:hypothetical protein